MQNKSNDIIDDMPIIGNIVILFFSIFFVVQCFKYLSTDENTTLGNNNPKIDFKGADTTILFQKKVDSSLKSFHKYIVNTTKGNLNIRALADTASKLLGSIKKDSPIVAKPSSVSGWSEYSKDGGASVFGFVSSQYLKKK
jgi:hypothetical protein